MTVEVRESYYFLMEGPAVNPDLVIFAQESLFYQITGALDGNQLNPTLHYASELNLFQITGRVGNSNYLYQSAIGFFMVMGTLPADVSVKKTSLFAVESVPSPELFTTVTYLYQITTV